MKKGIIVFLLFAILSAGCSAAKLSPAPQAETAPPPSAPAVSKAAESPSPAATSAPEVAGARKALLSETKNSVFFRSAPDSQPQPASAGMEILPPGGIETGEDARARLDLQPEGTIVRVGPNSSFVLSQLSEAEGKPQTLLELFFGKVYILLNGGSLTVKTPGGAAAVQGSVMSVEYNPKTKAVKVACLEGHCSLQDEEGNEVELTDMQMSFLFEGEAPTDPFVMDSEELWDWYEEIPEMPDFFEEMPNPEDFPDPYFDFEFQYEMPTFEPGWTPDPGAMEDPTGGGAPLENPNDGGAPTEDPTGGGAPPEIPNDGGDPSSGGPPPGAPAEP